MTAIEEQFRRMAFNIIGRNQDDHVKNIAFLMDRHGVWKLSPAYDITWSYNAEGRWTSQHQMSMNGKRDGFTRDDFLACGRTVSLSAARVKAILADVHAALADWPAVAAAAGVDPAWRSQVEASLRLDLR